MIRLVAFVAGVEGPLPEGLSLVLLGPVEAIVRADAADEHDDVVRQGHDVQALLDVAGAVLPVRYGERFSDVGALEDAVAPQADAIASLLDRVDGCVELTVRVARPSGPGLERPADGGSYLRSRLRGATADAAAADALHSLLQRRAREAVLNDTTLSGLVHDACYLVERPEVDAFADDVCGYGAVHPELSLVCTGPWAPGSFAEVA